MSRAIQGLDPFPSREQIEAKLRERLPTRPDVAQRTAARKVPECERNNSGREITGIRLPCTLVFPYSVLVADNEKSRAGSDGRAHNTKAYRAKKAAIQAQAAKQLGPVAPTVVPLYAVYRFVFPDARRRDATNFLKATNDALSGVVYVDDCQLQRGRWEVVVDVDRPRLELTFSQILEDPR